MNKKVNIVVDASGSMTEDDKNTVVRYILNGINNIKGKEEFEDYSFELFQWGESTKKIDDMEKGKIEYRGRAQRKGLMELDKLLDDGAILLISDGNIEREEKKILKESSRKIVPICVGVDANRALLQDISTEKIVYSVVDLLQAIKSI